MHLQFTAQIISSSQTLSFRVVYEFCFYVHCSCTIQMYMLNVYVKCMLPFVKILVLVSFPGADMNDTMMTDEHRELRGTAGLLLDSIICFKFHSTDAHHHNHIWGSIVKFSQTQYLLFSTHVVMEMWNNWGQSCCLFIAWRFKLIIIHLILSGLFRWCVSLIQFWPGYHSLMRCSPGHNAQREPRLWHV